MEGGLFRLAKHEVLESLNLFIVESATVYVDTSHVKRAKIYETCSLRMEHRFKC